MDTLLHDLRYALRTLAKSPGFTAIAVLTLALGIGANTSIFTLVNAALFRPAPAAHPEELAWLATTRDFGGGRVSYQRRASYPEYRDYATRATSFTGLIAFTHVSLALGSGGEPERIDGLLVSGNYFSVLGLTAAAGRFFAPEEDAAGAAPVAILGHALWQRRFGGAADVAGTEVILNGQRVIVIGIAPAGFVGTQLGSPIAAWLPMAQQAVAMPRSPGLLEERHAGWLDVMGRLKPGVTPAAASAEVRTIAAQLAAAYPAALEHAGAVVEPVTGGLDPANRQEGKMVFSLLMLVPGFVLLIACANVANLLLARAAGRRREIGIRLALGATRGRLIRQLLTESLLLALFAGAAGMLLSYWISDALVILSGAPLEVSMALTPDLRVLLFTAALAAVTGIVFGLAPALGATRSDLVPALKEDGITTGLRLRRSRLVSTFVVTQISGSLVLVVMAGLFLQTLGKALQVDPGFDPKNLATLGFDLGGMGYTADQRGVFYARLLERVRGMSGIRNAGLAAPVPLSGTNMNTQVVPEGAAADDFGLPTSLASVSPGYFATMALPLIRGRDFTPQDAPGAPLVTIVNETLAQRLWPGEDPIGKRLRNPGERQAYRIVVGLARDSKYDELTERARPFYYLPERQESDFSDITLIARTAGDPRPLLAGLTAAVHELDARLPVYRVATMQDAIRERLGPQRAASSLLGAFGALALLLAALGLYAVMAFAVTQRTREIGIRMALGAGQREVLGMFVGEGVRLAAVGIVIGLVASFALTRVISSFLYGVRATDLPTFLLGAVILALVAALASYLPARRAARVDPMVALRYE